MGSRRARRNQRAEFTARAGDSVFVSWATTTELQGVVDFVGVMQVNAPKTAKSAGFVVRIEVTPACCSVVASNVSKMRFLPNENRRSQSKSVDVARLSGKT